MSNLTPSLQQLAADPALFRAHLLIDTDAGPRPLGRVCDAWQEQDFRALDRAWLRVAGRVDEINGSPQRAYLERPRGHSKTSDLAVQCLWAMFASRRQLAGVAAAADRDQARLLRDAIERLVRLNLWLAEYVELQAYRILNPHTGSTLEIISSDEASSWGLTPDFVVCDELVNWQREELWHSLVSAAEKRKHCVFVTISNAGITDGGTAWQWEAREKCRVDPDFFFSRLDAPAASWITQDRLDRQRRLLPDIAFRRLWLNEWTSGAGDALAEGDITAAIDPTLKPLVEREPAYAYASGLDIGIRHDASAFVTVGRHVGATTMAPAEPAAVPQEPPISDTLAAMIDLGLLQRPAPIVLPRQHATEYRTVAPSGRMRLADCQRWAAAGKGKVDLSQVEAAVLAAHQRFRMAVCLYDPHQCEHLAQRLLRAGVPMVACPFTGGALGDMASALLESFNQRLLVLYEHDLLLYDLRKLRIAEKSYGVRLESPRDSSGHGDLATALALAVLAARRHLRHATGPRFLDPNRRLAYY